MLSATPVEQTRLLLAMDAEIRGASSNVDRVKTEVARYLREKVSNLPQDIFVADNFDHEAALFSSELISQEGLEIWACRFNEPDTTVPGRSWILEIAIGVLGERHLFGGRLSCFDRNRQFEFDPATPRLFRGLISQGLLNGDGIRLTSDSNEVTSDDEVEWLLALLNNPRRWRDVIVLSCDSDGNCALNIEYIARRLSGAAHVVKIYPDASFELSEKVSRHLSVFDGGVRIYRPSSDIASDEPTRHPLVTRFRISESNAQSHVSFLLKEAFRESVNHVADKADVLPSFANVRATASKFRLIRSQEAGGSSDQQIKAASEARQAAEAQAAEALNLAMQEEQLRREMQTELDMERGRSLALSARIRALEEVQESQRISTVGGRPKKYSEISEWVSKDFAGRLRLHQRALRGLKAAQFEDIALVCRCLEELAGPYVDSKRGREGAWDKFNNAMQKIGVEVSRAISETRAGEQGEEYFIAIRERC